MHELLEQILNNRDLSKAGDIFSLDDKDIEDDLETTLEKVLEIIDDNDYHENNNDQSVIEICVTRITSAIRDTNSTSTYCAELVKLLECCLKYNLKPEVKDENPPHAKIASDIFSCLFPKNYTERSVMKLTLPVAVRFLPHDNKELCRHITSYLSLAASENADILAEFLPIILESSFCGNHSLVRILTYLYPENKPPVHKYLSELIELFDKCDEQAEKTCLIQTLSAVAKDSPHLLVCHIDMFMSLLSNVTFCTMVSELCMHIAVTQAEAFTEYIPKLKTIAGQQSSSFSSVAKIVGAVGRTSKTEAEEILAWLVEQLAETDLTNLAILLQEIKLISEHYVELVTAQIEEIRKYEHHSTTASTLIAQIKENIYKVEEKEVKSISVQTDADETDVFDSLSTAKASGSPSESPILTDSLNDSPTTSNGTQNNNIPTCDTIQHFCDKHLDKIKIYINKVSQKLPLPCKASVEERKTKRRLLLQFSCSGCSPHCLYSGNYFNLKTKMPKTWIHLMFLAEQARSPCALSLADPTIDLIKSTWDKLNADSFTRVVFSAFPSAKDEDFLIDELCAARFFDMFMFNKTLKIWCCFTCNDPEKVSDLLKDGAPVIEGQLKEKKGRWNFFKRWKTRYFTLSGSQITYSKGDSKMTTLPVSKIQSVKSIRRGNRDIPKAFEIFTNDDEKFILKAKDSKDNEQWVQCLHIAVAQSHKDEAVVDLSDKASCGDQLDSPSHQ